MKTYAIDVTINCSLPQEKRDLLLIELQKKFIEIAGDDFNGTCLIFSSSIDIQDENLNPAEKADKIINKGLNL